MKPTFIALLALCLCVVGCGKKVAGRLAQTSQSEPTPKGETPRTEPKQESEPSRKSETPRPELKQESQAIKPGTLLWTFATGGVVHTSPAIGSDGTVYVGSTFPDKKLYAIKTDSKGLAKSPWPMHGQNARHTGRVLKK